MYNIKFWEKIFLSDYILKPLERHRNKKVLTRILKEGEEKKININIYAVNFLVTLKKRLFYSLEILSPLDWFGIRSYLSNEK